MTATAVLSDHGQLDGRADDDHVQYILVSGARAFTGTCKLAAGAAAAGKAPLKFTAGPLLTVKEDGAMEFFDGHFYLTSGDRGAINNTVAVKTTTTTVVNSTTETVIHSHLFAANSFHSDQRIILSFSGSMSAAGGGESLTMRFKLDGVVIHSFVVTPKAGSDRGWRGAHEVTIRSIGVAGTHIDLSEFYESGQSPEIESQLSAHTIDTTADTLYELTAQWGAAKSGNSFSVTQADITYRH